MAAEALAAHRGLQEDVGSPGVPRLPTPAQTLQGTFFLLSIKTKGGEWESTTVPCFSLLGSCLNLPAHCLELWGMFMFWTKPLELTASSAVAVSRR